MARRKGLLTVSVSLALLASAPWALAQAGADDGTAESDLTERVQRLERMLVQMQSELKAAKQELAEQREADERERVAATEAAEAEKPKRGEDASGTIFDFGGFIASNFNFSKASDGDIGGAGAEFYIPGTIPVGGEGGDWDLHAHAKQSRFFFKTSTALDNGSKLSTHIEMDFYLSRGGDERVSNSYNPRLRHAYVRYDDWLFGQTWSNFQDVGVLPESVEFIGPSEGTTFQRQAQVRYSHGPWSFSAENPETTVTPFGGGGRIVTDDGALPDVTARYTMKGDWGHFSVAGLLRQLEIDNGPVSDETSAFGVSFSGKYMLGRDDIRFMLTHGDGVGRYLGLNTSNGAVLDATGGLDAISQTGGFLAYRHLWTDKLRSTLLYSRLDIDNDVDLTSTGVTKSVYSSHINLMYSPVPNLSFGAEYLFAERELENGGQGDLNRLILQAKYSF